MFSVVFIDRAQNSRITKNIWKNYSRMDVTIYLDLLRMVTPFKVEDALVTHHEKVTATFSLVWFQDPDCTVRSLGSN